jgi:hypothetical protein
VKQENKTAESSMEDCHKQLDEKYLISVAWRVLARQLHLYLKYEESTLNSAAICIFGVGIGHTSTGLFIFCNVAIFWLCSKTFVDMHMIEKEALAFCIWTKHHVPSSNYIYSAVWGFNMNLSNSAIFGEIMMPICFLLSIWSLLYCVLFYIPWIPWSWGMRWHSWLRHCATSWKVTGSIPDGVIGIFYWLNPSGHTVALGSTQPVTEMSTRHISGGIKVASA